MFWSLENCFLFLSQNFPAAMLCKLYLSTGDAHGNLFASLKTIMFSSHVMLQSPFFYQKLHCNGWKSWSWGPKKAGCKGLAQPSHASSFVDCPFLMSKKCFLLMWAFGEFSISKVALHRSQEEGSPCSSHARAVFVGWSCAVQARKWSAGKKTRLQSSIRTNARKCLPPGQETQLKTGKKDNQEVDRQLSKKPTATGVAK